MGLCAHCKKMESAQHVLLVCRACVLDRKTLKIHSTVETLLGKALSHIYGQLLKVVIRKGSILQIFFFIPNIPSS